MCVQSKRADQAFVVLSQGFDISPPPKAATLQPALKHQAIRFAPDRVTGFATCAGPTIGSKLSVCTGVVVALA